MSHNPNHEFVHECLLISEERLKEIDGFLHEKVIPIKHTCEQLDFIMSSAFVQNEKVFLLYMLGRQTMMAEIEFEAMQRVADIKKMFGRDM